MQQNRSIELEKLKNKYLSTTQYMQNINFKRTQSLASKNNNNNNELNFNQTS